MEAKPISNNTLNLFQKLHVELENHIVGQSHLIKRLLVTLLADGHLLVEGAPGLAKTKAIKTLADYIEGEFHRIQFTPDLLPADITGTDIFRPQTNTFEFQEGPLFHNFILADEINRAPAKVQSALLEAMAEHQITIGQKTYPLPKLFLVMATQNSIEQEGTYPLPEAQLDRFLLFVKIDFPDMEAEKQILALNRQEIQDKKFNTPKSNFSLSQSDLFTAREEVLTCHLAPQVEEYIVRLTHATREPAKYDKDLAHYISSGSSPRASITLDRTTRALAWLENRDFVSPSDVQALAHEAYRHRIIPSFEAQAHNVTTDQIIDRLLDVVAVP